jgi:amino acid transporter
MSLILALFLAFSLIMVLYFKGLPYGTEQKKPIMIITCVVAVLFVLGLSFYFYFIFSPINNYVKKLIDVLSGVKKTTDATIISINNELFDKNGVNFYYFNCLSWSDTTNDYVERKVYVDSEVKIDFNEGQMLNITTCDNILISYEVKQ